MWTMLMQTIASARETGQSPAEASRSTGAMVPIVSAVPAGLVIARDEVLGISMPCAATMGTTTIVTRLPAVPPSECLSTTGVRPQSTRCIRLQRKRATQASSSSSRSLAQATSSAFRSAGSS